MSSMNRQLDKEHVETWGKWLGVEWSDVQKLPAGKWNEGLETPNKQGKACDAQGWLGARRCLREGQGVSKRAREKQRKTKRERERERLAQRVKAEENR